MKIKPKAYGPIFVRMVDDGTLRYGIERANVNDAHPPATTPAEILLASIGACMVVSIRIVAAKKNVKLNAFDVEVSATKAENFPSRLARYEIRVSPGLIDESDLAESIVKQAKSVCTVSNSLNGEIALILS